MSNNGFHQTIALSQVNIQLAIKLHIIYSVANQHLFSSSQ